MLVCQRFKIYILDSREAKPGVYPPRRRAGRLVGWGKFFHFENNFNPYPLSPGVYGVVWCVRKEMV